MGVENHRLEMLFLASSVRSHGLGRQLMQYGDEHYGITELTVNEQNPPGRRLLRAPGLYHLQAH